LPEDRKSTQRERLVRSMSQIAAHEGYAAATIAKVINHAGVSRPTFYEYFADKDACFLASLTDAQAELHGRVTEAVAKQPPARAVLVAIRALVRFAIEDPTPARLLINEPLAAGPAALDARDAGIAKIARVIEGAHGHAPPTVQTPDISSRVLIGGVYRLLAWRLRRDVLGLDGVVEHLLPWIESYEQPADTHHWSALRPLPPPAPWPLIPESRLRAPALTPHGPGRLTAAVAENQRQRILFATAEIAQEKGYTAATVTDITTRAGVDHRAFSRLFADKQQAFMTIHELGFQRTMAVTARAFVAGTTWPDRIWEAGRAFTQFFEENPAIAHIAFVESNAVGDGAVRRVEDSLTAFTIFLTEGLRDMTQDAPSTNPLALEAIATTIFEIGYHESRRNQNREMSNLLPHVTVIALAPFLGAADANEFIDQKLGDSARPRPPTEPHANLRRAAK
jgi:AcrR family transcriptional regulator